MIKTHDAIRAARALLGTPYAELDCIALIVRVIRTAPGGVPSYRTAGTNTLWKSFEMGAKYKDLIWRQESVCGARAGMLAFKRSGKDVHHVGLVTGEGTVIHSSSAKGSVVETALDGSWGLLAMHRTIEAAGDVAEKGETKVETTLYQAEVRTQSSALNLRSAPDGTKIGSLPKGATVDVLNDSDNAWWRVRYEGAVGYASAAYLARVFEAVDGVEDSGWMSGDPEAGGAVAESLPTTTLMREDGVCIVLCGRWRVAED